MIDRERVSQGTTYLFVPRRLGQRWFMKWISGTHSWLGFFVVVAVMLYAVSGFVLNHGGRLRLDLATSRTYRRQLAVPENAQNNQAAFSLWLQAELGVSRPLPISVTENEPKRWQGKMVPQPDHWRGGYDSPQKSVHVDYSVGNRYARLVQEDLNVFHTMNRLHRSRGIVNAWILFADLTGLAFIVLPLTGIFLWTRLHGRRSLAITLGLMPLFITLGLLLKAVLVG